MGDLVKLRREADAAKMAFDNIAISNVKTDPKDKAKQRIEYDLAYIRLLDAERMYRYALENEAKQ